MRGFGSAEAMQIHATAVVVGEHGLLLRGSSGAGKSTLARELIAAAESAGRFARLVCDDRVSIEPRDSRLVARALPEIAGLLEIRGLGICPVPYEPSAVIRLVVDLNEHPPRLPAQDELLTEIAGSVVPRIVVNRALAPRVILNRLQA